MERKDEEVFTYQNWPIQDRSSLGLSFPTLQMKGQAGLLRSILRAKSLVPGHVGKPSLLWLCVFPPEQRGFPQITELGAHFLLPFFPCPSLRPPP